MNDELINRFRESESVSWVAEQLEETISKGRTMSVRDVVARDDQRNESLGLSPAEKKKRLTYETTIDFSESEILEIIKIGYEAVFLTLPSAQKRALEVLKDLDIDFDRIEFEASDEPGIEQSSHSLSQENLQFDVQQTKTRLSEYFRLVEQYGD